MSFQITSSPITELNLKDSINPTAGAFVSFQGVVRNHNDGRAVLKLKYECHQELAQKEAQKIINEIRVKFNVIDIKSIHRIGELNVGDMAVWVGVSSAHRDDAFKAVRYLIDEIKHRLPIWKKEFYTNGDSGWVNCQNCQQFPSTNVKLTEEQFYLRQIKLNELGPEGQRKLKYAKVLVVGAGGLGCSTLPSLAAAGVGTIGICEYDLLDASNLHRQTLYDAKDIGRFKVDLAAQRIKSINPFIEVLTHNVKLTAANVAKLIEGYDIIVDCTDNFKTKFIVNDAAVLHKKVLVQSSIYQFEGQIRIYDSNSKSACLRCLWPKTPQEGCVGTCADVGVLGVTPAIFGHFQALETIKHILGLSSVLKNETLLFNGLDYTFQKIQQLKNPDCPVCSSKGDDFIMDDQVNPNDIDIDKLSNEELKQFTFVDVREPVEKEMKPITEVKCLELPFGQFLDWDYSFDKKTKYLFFCEKGLRSQRVVEELQKQGFNQMYSLIGGANSIKRCFQNA